MSACSSEMCAAHSGSGRWDEDSQHCVQLVSSSLWRWDEALLAPSPVQGVLLLGGLVHRASRPSDLCQFLLTGGGAVLRRILRQALAYSLELTILVLPTFSSANSRFCGEGPVLSLNR